MLLYKIKMVSGHTIHLRGVRKFEYDAKAGRFSAVLPGWSKYSGHGVEHTSIDEDPEWWGATVAIIDPKSDDGSAAADVPGKGCPSGYEVGLVSCADYKPMVVGEPVPEIFRREACVPAELATTTFAPLENLTPKADDRRKEVSEAEKMWNHLVNTGRIPSIKPDTRRVAGRAMH